MLHLLLKFENIVGKQMDLSQKYAVVLQHFASDLDQVRKVYKKHKDNPPILRNMPPVSATYVSFVFVFLYFIFLQNVQFSLKLLFTFVLCR